MARSTGVHIEGLRETIRNLEKLGVNVEDLRNAFGTITADVQREVEAGIKRDSGALAGSVRPARTKNKAVIRAGTARVPYAAVINYGWPAHGIEGDQFLTGPANRDPDRHATAIERELEDLIRRYGLD